MNEGASPNRLGLMLRWAGATLIAAGALTRASVGFEAFPYWSQDPTIISGPMTSLGPTGSLLVDSVILLGAGLGMLGEVLAGRGAVLWLWLLAGLGAARALLYVQRDLDLDNARISVTWLAAVAGGVALAHLGRDAALRRVLAAVLLGFVAMLAVKGGLQVFVEHPQTVADYGANKAAFLAASGWSEGSPMARAFERRLMQPEASGWFGMANVYASFAAVGTVALAGLAAVGWWASRPARQLVADGVVGVVGIGVVAAAAAVVMAGSKAGYVVTGLGVGLAAAAFAVVHRGLRMRPAVAGMAGVGVLALALGAVVARGLVGERLHEPSILFRWFYLQGATRAFLAHPWMGTGPDGFKQAYMLLKPALSPENVESPHSILFDYAARLGVMGLGWCGVFVGLVWCCGRVLLGGAACEASSAQVDIEVAKPTSMARTTERVRRWAIIGLASVPTLLGAWIESAATTPESAIARGVGLLAWIALSLCVLAVLNATAWGEVVVAAAAIALAAHAQIEMTGVFVGSAALFFAVLGLAASPALAAVERRKKSAVMVSASCLASLALVSVFVTVKVWRWESLLREAAEKVAPLAEFRARLAALSSGSARGDTLDQLARDLSATLGQAVPRDGVALDHLMLGLADLGMEVANLSLVLAHQQLPSHEPTVEAASRLLLSHASLIFERESAFSEQGAVLCNSSTELARAGAQQANTASAWGWAGTVYRAAADMQNRIDGRNSELVRQHLSSALRALTIAASLDPHGATFPMQVMDLELSRGNPVEAAEWARKVLSINEDLRLDPLVQLTPEEKARVERVARGGP